MRVQENRFRAGARPREARDERRGVVVDIGEAVEEVRVEGARGSHCLDLE